LADFKGFLGFVPAVERVDIHEIRHVTLFSDEKRSFGNIRLLRAIQALNAAAQGPQTYTGICRDRIKPAGLFNIYG